MAEKAATGRPNSAAARLLDALSISLVCALACLPRNASLRAGALLGAVVGAVTRRKTRRIEANLAMAGCARARASCRVAWTHCGATLFEMLWNLTRPPEEVLRSVRIRGLDSLRDAAAGGRGILLVSGHVGNWELVSLAAAQAGLPVAVVARHLKAPALERRLCEFRERGNVRTFFRDCDGASIAAYRWLRRGGVLGCMMDRASGGPRLRVPFLGRSTNLPLGPLSLASKTGAAVVLGFARRRADVTEVVFKRLRDAEGARDPGEAGRIVGHALEAEIHGRPEQWFWIYRRQQPADGA